jgi:hypothetical protein
VRGGVRLFAWQAGLVPTMSPSYLVHDSSLLLQRHGDRVLVAVAVQADFMASVGDHAAFFWERLERVTGNEPCGLDVVPLEHLQETADTYRSGEETWRVCLVDREGWRLRTGH